MARLTGIDTTSSPDEVRFLMGFNRDVIRRRRDEMHELGVRVRWAGRAPRLWRSVIKELQVAEELTKANDVLTLTMCVNYGGRAEIADAQSRKNTLRHLRSDTVDGDEHLEEVPFSLGGKSVQLHDILADVHVRQDRLLAVGMIKPLKCRERYRDDISDTVDVDDELGRALLDYFASEKRDHRFLARDEGESFSG